MSSYDLINDNDYSHTSFIYKEIKNIDIFRMEDVSYNFYYTHDFINNNFRVLYRILESVDDGILLIDKNYKYLKFEDVVKIIYHMKRKLINPLVNDIFNFEEKRNRNLRDVIKDKLDELK